VTTNHINTRCPYKHLGDHLFNEDAHKIAILFAVFCNEKFQSKNIPVAIWHNLSLLREVAKRVDQRKYYHDIFHDMEKGVSEVKRMAWTCLLAIKVSTFAL